MTKPRYKNKYKYTTQPKQKPIQKEDDRDYLSFSFRYLVKHRDFDIDNLDKSQKSALLETLNLLSSQKWIDLQLIHKHGKGSEKIPKHTLNFSLPVEIPDDITMLAFRFYDKSSIIGYRNAYGTFYIVALDRNYKAYDHS